MQQSPASVLSSGRRPGERPNGFRTIQVCPKDWPTRLLQAEGAVVRPLGGGRMFDLRRRDFVTLLGGAVAWPLAAPAQQGDRMRRVAFLHPYTENDPEVLARVVAFRQGLEALGWTENRNIRIEHRYSGGDLGQI